MTRVPGPIRALVLAGLLAVAAILWTLPGATQPISHGPRDSRPEPPPTAHEAFASMRAGEAVRLFGYRLFDGPMLSRRTPVGRVGPEYRLGPGDRLRVVWQAAGGTQDTDLRVGVDATLIVPGLPPLSVLDLTLAEATDALARAADRADRGSRIAISVTGVRQIGVLVVGEVAEPGLHQVPATGSVLDVLLAAGGVRRGACGAPAASDPSVGSRRPATCRSISTGCCWPVRARPIRPSGRATGSSSRRSARRSVCWAASPGRACSNCRPAGRRSQQNLG